MNEQFAAMRQYHKDRTNERTKKRVNKKIKK